MIVTVMAFLMLVAVVASLAALVAEHGLRRLGAPVRWVWLGAMSAGWVLLALGGAIRELTRSAAEVVPVMQPVVLDPVFADGGGVGWDPLLVIPAGVWLLASLVTALLLVLTHRGLLRERARWERGRVLEQDVFLSTDRGPAVAGVLRPWIVLPRWVLSLRSDELRMVLLHEEEHVRARDCALLAAALTLVVLTAWNPLVWWQLRRLRSAVELDCDRRVLDRAPDRGAYGESLISVAARASGPSLGLAAFTERGSSLKRRIAAMTETKTRWTMLGGGLLVVLAVLVGVQACFIEVSVAVNDADGEEDAATTLRETPAIEAVEIEERADAPVPPEEVTATVRERAPIPPPPVEGRATTAELQRRVEAAAGEAVFRASEMSREEIAAAPTFTPMTARPEILNRTEIMAAMEREYPPLLRDAGIGGTVRVHFFIDEEGDVEKALVAESSGHRAIDEAALRVAEVYEFSPARNRDETVPVWVQFGITFQVR